MTSTRTARALLSVSDKRGIAEFAGSLAAAGFELVSTGGTFRVLVEAGLEVTPVDRITGIPEMLGGRVKTLHPAVHGAILGRRDRESDLEDWRRHGMVPIDVVVVNLYPFEETLTGGARGMDLLEQIDIGGPAMVRAAAKNWPWVTVVVDPDDYGWVGEALAGGGLEPGRRRELAARAFAHTGYYDAVVAGALQAGLTDGIPGVAEGTVTPPEGRGTAGAALPDDGERVPDLPRRLVVPLCRTADLRYGENPHQRAALYLDTAAAVAGLAGARQHQGRRLSFNNYQDAEAAWRMASAFQRPTAVAVKHTNPCGAASADRLAEAFTLARDADPVSIFGGIVALNGPVDEETARLLAGIHLDLVVAPQFLPGTLEILAARKNLRVLEVPRRDPAAGPDLTTQVLSRAGLDGLDARRITGALLVQEEDAAAVDPTAWRVVTRARPEPAELASLAFAWRLVRFVKSNAIVLARGEQAVGIGAGQTNRVDSVRHAVNQAGERATGAVLASDAFFPFPDGIEAAAAAGITTVAQPGGSIRDEEVIAACDRLGVAMLFTGVRHFLH